MIRVIAALFLIACSSYLLAQACPVNDPNGPPKGSETRTLHGKLIFHDSIRKWFELKLDKPECGQASIELVRADKSWIPLQVLRGCRVESYGVLGLSTTGYYSLDQYQDVTRIEAIEPCVPQKPFPDYSKLKPAKEIRSYRVVMKIHYGQGDSPVHFHVTSRGKELQPWRAYASYMLTGGYVLYGECAEDFVVDRVFGTPQAHPGHFDEPRDPSDMATFDPESGAAAGKKELWLGYTCVRGK